MLNLAVFSTYVEVFPSRCATLLLFWRLLHVRGGVSALLGIYHWQTQSSPRTWRCFLTDDRRLESLAVFSTYVEVFPTRRLYRRLGKRLLHVRGGVSERLRRRHRFGQSSPRTWRCFSDIAGHIAAAIVFSTYVEVFPTRSTGSPKTTVFSTYVEVFPRRLA